MDSVISSVLDAQGRAVEHLPAEVGRALLQMDRLLRDSEMRFNIECPDCSQQMGRPVYVIPAERGGRVEFVCPHSRRISTLTTA